MAAAIRACRRMNTGQAFLALCCIAGLIRLLANACVIDDAFITFRVIDHLFQGEGLRWNIDERVQVYTHPLWMLLQIPMYGVIGNFYITGIVLSLDCCLLSVLLMALMTPASPRHRAILVILPLSLSQTMNAYMVSGLEVPLTCCMLAWFLREFIRKQCRLTLLWFIASLCVLVRFDNALLIAPALAWMTWQHRHGFRALRWLAAVSPLLLWCGFSLIYYGFILPNTKYAKLNTGVPLLDEIGQGFKYLFNFSYYDTLSFCVIAIGLGVAATYAQRIRKTGTCVDSDELRRALIGAGMLLNILYIIAVGGDYMSGRFFAGVFFVTVALLYICFCRCSLRKLWMAGGALAALSAAHAVMVPLLPDLNDHRLHFGINDHHSMYYHMNGLFSDPDHWFRTDISYDIASMPKYDPLMPRKLAVNGFIGYPGFYSDSDLIIIDYHALSDVLMARLPITDLSHWRIGHFTRTLPEGYLQARMTDDTTQMDPSLARYYQKLRLVTSGDLWSFKRLRTIIGFQFGWYDHWRNDYLRNVKNAAPQG